MPKKNVIVIVVVISLIAVVFIANQASNTSSTQNQTSSSISTTSKTTLNNIKDLQDRLNSKNPDDVLIDVRTPEEFTNGHIENAVNIDLENSNFVSEINKLDKNKTYIVFCRSGNRAETASNIMLQNGFKNIVYSKEGITAWQSTGLKTIN